MQKIIEVKGKYADALVFSKDCQNQSIDKIEHITSLEASKDTLIRVMPDVHPAGVGVVGLTMKLADKVMPALVGYDIGCGITYVKFKAKNIELSKLDKTIKKNIPSGSSIRDKTHLYSKDFDFDNFICRRHINIDKAKGSLGTLGGGNHFIELGKDDEGYMYLVVHSGSRGVGREIAEHYLREGQRVLKKRGEDIPYELTYLEDELFEDYIKDCLTAVEYSMLNREIILREILKPLKIKAEYWGECIHNYIDEEHILRKGAISAKVDEEVVIPINMRDGIVLGVGKGNSEWNFSAPHGAGRLLSRAEVKERYTASQLKKEMSGIYMGADAKDCLDEAPFAYRSVEQIKNQIKDTVEIKKIIKPIYNYKADERR